jgi:arsenate reductase
MTVTRVRVYHYPNCSTCRKALAWLTKKRVAFDAVHIVERTPSAAELKRLWKKSGLPIKKWFNTSGGSYREGKWGEKLAAGLSDDAALSALAADGKLIKRPIVDAGDVVLVGFDEAAYAELAKR